jgi:hypothetical protein
MKNPHLQESGMSGKNLVMGAIQKACQAASAVFAQLGRLSKTRS